MHTYVTINFDPTLSVIKDNVNVQLRTIIILNYK